MVRAIRIWPLLLAVLASCKDTPKLQQLLPPEFRVDVFPQASRAQLDALFVIDNARYMGPHQKKVADSFHRFLGYLDKNVIDYHIGLVTTDVVASPGQFQGGGKKYFAAGDSDLASALPNAVLALGDQGGTVSPTLQQLDLALRAPPQGFLRDGASLFLVAVTNDDDPWSPGDDLYYFRMFKQAKGPGNDALVTYSALAGDVPQGCRIPDPNNPAATFFAQPAVRQQGFAARMGGLFHSVCDPSFDQVFDDLGATAAGLKRTFRLAKLPDETTLTIDVRAPCDANRAALAFCSAISDECGEAQPALVCTPKLGADGATYDAATNSVIFAATAVPPRASLIEITYKDREATP
jgi:hypothetical protein